MTLATSFKIAMAFQAALIIASARGCLPIPMYVAAAPMLVVALFGGVFLIKILRV